MKTSISRPAAGIIILAAAFILAIPTARAQVYPTTCPTATVFYPNGYSMSPCVPSYPNGYPNITVYPGNGITPGTGAFYNSGGFTAIQTNPFTNPMYSNSGLFAPGMTQTGPTYYYPPAPTYPNGYYYGGNYNGGAFYNTPGTCFEGCGNYHGGNGGYWYPGDGYWYGGWPHH